MDFSAVHIHLAINHSPLYTELFALCLMLFGMLRARREFVTAGLVVAIVAALCAIGANLTGDKAADFVSHVSPPLAGVDKELIRPHDEAAGWFVNLASGTGVLAIIALFIGHRRGSRPRWLEALILLAMALSVAAVARTSLLGGRIHHQEVRALTAGSHAP